MYLECAVGPLKRKKAAFSGGLSLQGFLPPRQEGEGERRRTGTPLTQTCSAICVVGEVVRQITRYTQPNSQEAQVMQFEYRPIPSAIPHYLTKQFPYILYNYSLYGL